MKTEVHALMEELAKTLASVGNQTYEEAYAAREHVRTMNRLSAIMERHCALHPESVKNDNPLLIKAFHSGPNGDQIDYEAYSDFLHQFDHLANAPQQPAEKKPTFLQKLSTRK